MPIRALSATYREMMIKGGQSEATGNTAISRPNCRGRSRIRIAPANDAGNPPPSVADHDRKAAQPRPAVLRTARAKTVKTKSAKKQPTGDYPVGYCKPPVDTQFDGSRPGPGRPPGALSQDTLLKKHLTQVRPVSIEGKQTKMQNRELVLAMRIKEALSGNRHAVDYVLAQAARLFSERADMDGKGAPLPADIDAHDRAILDALEAALLARALGDDSIEEDADADGDQSGDPGGDSGEGGR